jgi:hypothetical protein
LIASNSASVGVMFAEDSVGAAASGATLVPGSTGGGAGSAFAAAP